MPQGGDTLGGRSGGNLGRLLVTARLAAGADRPAVESPLGAIDAAGLARLVDSIAGRLRAAGAAPGERVLVVAPNSVELLAATLAALCTGCVAVPVAADAGPERLRYLTEVTEPVVCLAHPALSPPRRTGTAVLTLRVEPGRPGARLEPDPGAAPESGLPVGGDAPAMILFSSGSTGRPKGVVLSHRQLLWPARMLASLCRLDAAHRELILCPLSHSDGWDRAAATLLSGGAVVLDDGPLSIAGLLEDCRRLRIGGFFTPPPLIRYLLQAEPSRVRSALAGCRAIEIGSAPIAAEELRSFVGPHSAAVFVHYGLTEFSRGVVLAARERLDKLDTVGRPAPDVEMVLVDERSRPVPAGRTGQILLRGPQLALGYWRDPPRTAERFVDGWHVTGDWGSVDDEGFLTLHGRRDDLITSAGHHFFPAEVETELGPVPGVTEYLVAGVRDPRGLLEQVPWAFVVPADPAGWSVATFFDAARRRLPGHMVPKRVQVVPELPRTPSGKPDRRQTVLRFAASPADRG